MSHLSTERLAALADEEPTAPEAAHLAACGECSRERAAYRTLGHHLATEGRYLFRDKPKGLTYVDQQDTRYPGLPLIMAAVEKLAGPSDRVAIIVIVLTAIAVIILT